ncbi:MAG: sigma 54-interacting transcriptional regulator [Kofleriaceae bacterium]|nr:sigma 54-interacting transcriptional regulator [Kofleriaceae bacterium]
MNPEDLRLTELVDFLPDQGRIDFEGHRMLLWHADAFGNLRKELIDDLGVDATRGILRRFGFANGYKDALTMRELLGGPDARAWWLGCPALQAQQGKVRPEVQNLTIDRERGEFELAVHWHDSYEAAQHQRVVGAATAPVCWTLAGYASGYSSAVLGEEVFVVEHACAAMGAPHCRVVGRTRRAWGEDGARHAAEYDAPALARQLDAVHGELRRATGRLADSEAELRRVTGRSQGGLIARSREMDRVLELANKVAAVDATVLVTGETGVGKERIARLIHDASPRAARAMVAINCAALPEALLESELFGHVAGAFTGAAGDRRGLFEAAAGGTVFLDEIGETTPSTQAKLLRVLQERLIRPVGASAERAVDVRIVAATNRDLAAMVAAGTFRADLLYRLRVVTIDLPPLRARRGELVPLARHFIARTCASYGQPVKTLAADAAAALHRHAWPGNVRELEHAIEHAVVLAGTEPRLRASHLPAEVLAGAAAAPPLASTDELMTIDELNRRYVLGLLRRPGAARGQLARQLGIGANTLWRWLKRWQLEGAAGDRPGVPGPPG